MPEFAPLEEFIASVCTESHLRVEDDLGDGFVRLRVEEAERRQAVHDIRSSEDILIELLRNARDAGSTEIYAALSRTHGRRRICVIDDGCGIPENLHEVVFEPRVTSKLDTMALDSWGVHGRGMALYSIRQNAEHAEICASGKGLGSSFLVKTDLSRIGEKRDQSAFPAFQMEDSTLKVLGPKNLIRTACEFALESNGRCSVYVGSCTEIAASLYAAHLGSVSAECRAFGADRSTLPVPRRLSATADPDDFAACAQSIGLDISSRSARRILDGQIAPVGDLLAQVSRTLARVDAQEAGDAEGQPLRKRPDQLGTSSSGSVKGLKIHEDDRRDFEAAVSAAYKELAAKYYLDGQVDPCIGFTRQGISVKIPFLPLD